MLLINKKVVSHKKNLSIKALSTKTLSTYLTAFTITGSLCFLPYSSHALVAVADTGSFYPGVGYGAQVLDIVLDTWKNPDPTAEGTSSITLRIAKDGRPFSCEIRKFSSSQMTDTSLCNAVAQIGVFPVPAGNQNSEITLTFVHEKNNTLAMPSTQNTEPPIAQQDTKPSHEVEKKKQNVPTQNKINNAPQISPMLATSPKNDVKITRKEALMPPSENLILPAEAMQEYSQNVLKQARSLIRVPRIPSGKYKIIARIDLDPKGVLKSSTIQTSSGVKDLDSEILRVLQEEITYPPTPYKDHQSIWLTFIVQK